MKYKLPATKGIMYGIPYIRREVATELGTRAPKRVGRMYGIPYDYATCENKVQNYIHFRNYVRNTIHTSEYGTELGKKVSQVFPVGNVVRNTVLNVRIRDGIRPSGA